MAYPANYRKFVAGGRELKTAYRHGGGEALDVQLRGEYLYAAMGAGGFRIFDVANVDVKDVSQRLISAPVSPLGQRLYVKTRFATAVASPSTLALDPLRKQIAENEEQPIAPLYAYLYVTDKYEGLVVVGNPKTGVGTLLDGDPRNNFLTRAATFNPEGRLNGARRITIAGTYAYILLRSRAGGGGPGRSPASPDHSGDRWGSTGRAAWRRSAVPLCVCGGPRGVEGVRRDPPRPSSAWAQRFL